MTQTSTGLEIRQTESALKSCRRWYVVHTSSNMQALRDSLRLKRQAEAAMADLYATGIDWANVKPQQFRDDEQVREAYGPVYDLWRNRVRAGWNEDGTEYYGSGSLADARWRRRNPRHDPYRELTAAMS